MSFADLERFSSLLPEGGARGGPVAAGLALAVFAIVVFRALRVRRGASPSDLPPAADRAASLQRDLLPSEDLDRLERSQPLAVFFVGGGHHLELQSLKSFREVYARQYSQILFVSVGLIDYAWMDSGARERGDAEAGENLKGLLQSTRRSLDPCIAAAHAMGLKADCRVAVSVDEAEELERLAMEVASRYSRSIFFISKIVWRRTSWLHRLLHAGTADALRGRLEGRGLPVTVLPVVIPVSA